MCTDIERAQTFKKYHMTWNMRRRGKAISYKNLKTHGNVMENSNKNVKSNIRRDQKKCRNLKCHLKSYGERFEQI